MSQEAFAASRLKVKWANHHIDDLEARLRLFAQSNSYAIVVKENLDPIQQSYRLISKPLPEETPLILGDAVHNLRASLDLLMCGITGDNEAKFPFRETRKEFPLASKNGSIQRIPGLWDFVLDEIKPYKEGGNYSLWAMNKLDIRDKHQLLIPLSQVTQVDGIELEDGNRNRMIFTKAVSADGSISLGRFATDGSAKIKNYGKASISVSFDKGQFFDGKPVILTMREVSAVVAKAITDIERFLSR